MTEVTYDGLQARFDLLRKEPEKFLALIEQFLRENPGHAGGYFNRHLAWERMGQLDKARDDLLKAIELKPNAAKYDALGTLYYRLGRYADAVAALDRAAALEPETWLHSPGPLFRADCHARLGNESAAVADCESLPEDHLLPFGLFGIPRGNKQDATAEIKRRAAAARAAPTRP